MAILETQIFKNFWGGGMPPDTPRKLVPSIRCLLVTPFLKSWIHRCTEYKLVCLTFCNIYVSEARCCNLFHQNESIHFFSGNCIFLLLLYNALASTCILHVHSFHKLHSKLCRLPSSSLFIFRSWVRLTSLT